MNCNEEAHDALKEIDELMSICNQQFIVIDCKGE